MGLFSHSLPPAVVLKALFPQEASFLGCEEMWIVFCGVQTSLLAGVVPSVYSAFHLRNTAMLSNAISR